VILDLRPDESLYDSGVAREVILLYFVGFVQCI
jgi:hypothetical protein